MTKDELREKANDLPLAPGVYLMMDSGGQVIYVGKAKKLKKPGEPVFSGHRLPQQQNKNDGVPGGPVRHHFGAVGV